MYNVLLLSNPHNIGRWSWVGSVWNCGATREWTRSSGWRRISFSASSGLAGLAIGSIMARWMKNYEYPGQNEIHSLANQWLDKSVMQWLNTGLSPWYGRPELYLWFISLGKPSLKKSHKTADLFRTSLSPPRHLRTLMGVFFSKSAYRRLATFGEKSAYATILGGTYPFHSKFIIFGVKWSLLGGKFLLLC